MARDSSQRLAAATAGSASNSLAATPETTKRGDKHYDFNAPQYYNFADPSPVAVNRDSWFEKNHSSPAQQLAKTTPKRLADNSPNTTSPPPTVTQTRKGTINKNDQPQSPTIIKGSSVAANNEIGNRKNSINIFDENSPPQNEKRTVPYEKLFEMVEQTQKSSAKKENITKVDKIKAFNNNGKIGIAHHEQQSNTKNFAPELGRVRTPDKVKLERLKTAAPLLPTRSTKALTVPVEFNFSERSRSNYRPFAAPSESNKIVAQPKKIHPSLNNIKSQEKRLTVPVSPKLLTKTRLKDPIAIIDHDADGLVAKSDFNVTLLPKQRKIEEIKPWKPRTTIPQSPNIMKSGNKRQAEALMIARTAAMNNASSVSFRARPVPDYNKPFVPKKEHHHSEPQKVQFSGDLIAERKRLRFQEALEKERKEAEQARQFHAQPMPKFELDNASKTSSFPTSAVKPLTKPEPFNLMSIQRHVQYQENFQKQLAEEEERLAEERIFHCRPAPHTLPFQPKKSTKSLTQAEEVKLYSSERAERRREFDEHLRAKEEDMLLLEMKFQEEKKKREDVEIRKLREELIPRARPVPNYNTSTMAMKQQQHLYNEKKLTVPMSPQLQTRLRSRKQL